MPLDPAHRRVLSARRRLLLMLVVLVTASGFLAGARMAAWWVTVPPSVMLFGYLLLLRAAAKSDAERRRDLAARSRATRTARTARPPVKTPVAAVAPASRIGAEVITIPGAEAAAPDPAEEEIYDQYTDAKLRAVGDLPRFPTRVTAPGG